MQPEQQRILGYFIEEAKEHLDTIENGLLNLQAVVDDAELMSEVFRAAHSVKGGAAMLGIHSMQHISHRLEDYFKVLRDHPVKVDAKIEALFLKIFDGLSTLTEELQNSLSLSDELSYQTIQSVEPVFAELQAHLAQLTGTEFELESDGDTVGAASAAAMSQEQTMVAFESDVLEQLRLMLQLFQADTSDAVAARQGLQEVCASLCELGAQAGLATWQNLVMTVSDAIAESKNALATLAAITIPALKEARDAVLEGHTSTIQPPQPLLSLIPAAPVLDSMDWFSVFSESAAAPTTAADSVESFLDDLLQEPQIAPQFEEVLPLAATAVSVDFEALKALLAEEPSLAHNFELEVPVAESFDSEFSDLERLLDAESSGAATGGRNAANRSNRRPGSAQTMKVGVKQLDNLSNLIGELVINRNTLEDNQDRQRQFLDNLLFQVQQLGELGQQMQDLYERSLLESSLLAATQRSKRSVPASRLGGTSGIFGEGDSEQTAHASGFSFDALEMDNFTGFHSLSQEIIERIVRVREAASDIQFVVDSNEQVTRVFRQVTTQVQEGLTTSRMIPFSQMAERLPRAIRDVSLRCGKQARLELEGRDTLIDKGILERIYDPLTHLVNNAIYHGLETPEVRQRLGKDPEGTIKIRVFYQGNQTIISIADDGAGIDIERVKTKAIEKGLITAAEAAVMSKQEIYAFLFQSGFSTNDQADQLAGRGVGMDVVRSSISDLRGVINTDSTPDKGTTFTIRLPLTLSITKALCCLHQNYSIAFPIDGVEDMLDLDPEQIVAQDDGQSLIVWRDRQLPCKTLTQMLPYNRTIKRGGRYHSPDSSGKVSVVILRSGDDFIGLQVDEVMGEQEIVIKQLTGPVPKPLGISGVTVQGDGRVMVIADVLELIDLSLDRVERNHQFWQGAAEIPVSEVETDPMVLIVDDSITVRELLSLTFSKAGYRVEQARDGMEAWEKLRSGLPCDLIFCDVEMPRMDGLELLSRLQQDEDLHDLPIAMLTSRGASKHKKMAVDLGAKGYFTKPYLEEVLLDAAQRMINGEVLIK